MGIKKKRLITFGCSWTVGVMLPDQQGDTPSKLAWPSILGDLLGRTVINKAKPGASNLEILYNILEFSFKEDDVIVVGWSGVNRDIIFDKSKRIIIGAWSDEDIVKPWTKIHTDYDLAIRSGIYMHHAELFLESLGIKQYHFKAFGAATLFDKIVNKFTEITPIYINKLKHQINKEILYKKDVALDGTHPGVESHKNAAKQLYKIIHEK